MLTIDPPPEKMRTSMVPFFFGIVLGAAVALAGMALATRAPLYEPLALSPDLKWTCIYTPTHRK